MIKKLNKLKKQVVIPIHTLEYCICLLGLKYESGIISERNTEHLGILSKFVDIIEKNKEKLFKISLEG